MYSKCSQTLNAAYLIIYQNYFQIVNEIPQGFLFTPMCYLLLMQIHSICFAIKKKPSNNSEEIIFSCLIYCETSLCKVFNFIKSNLRWWKHRKAMLIRINQWVKTVFVLKWQRGKTSVNMVYIVWQCRTDVYITLFTFEEHLTILITL